MDKELDGRFERLEKALATMIDSLSKNNPSTKLAQDLVAAETELLEGLKLLEAHQNNHARIQQLRQSTEQADAQIKDIISSLWKMRQELTSVQTSPIPKGAKFQFTTGELLDFARRISRNTLPPPGVTNGVNMTPAAARHSQQPSSVEPEDSFRVTSQSQTQTPNTSFNVSFNGTLVDTPGPFNNNSTPIPNAGPANSQNPHTELPEHLKLATNPLHGASFFPWPSVEQVRSGALGAYQLLVDKGIDPRGYDPEFEEQRRKDAEREAEERAKQEREEAERRAREEAERIARQRELERQRARESMAAAAEEGRRDSVVGGPAAGKPKQFTFLGGDDDDDDDDD